MKHIACNNNLWLIRTCNAIDHFQFALFIPALVGIQGRASLLLENELLTVSAGLLLARAYAVTDHKRLVLAILGVLGICTIVMDLVCTFISVTGM